MIGRWGRVGKGSAGQRLKKGHERSEDGRVNGESEGVKKVQTSERDMTQKPGQANGNTQEVHRTRGGVRETNSPVCILEVDIHFLCRTEEL